MIQRGYIDNVSFNNMYLKIACTLHDMQSKVLKESNFQVTGYRAEKFMRKQELPDSWKELQQPFRSQFSKAFNMVTTGRRTWELFA